MRGVYNALGSPVPSLPVRSSVLLRELAEGEGVEPSTQRSARLSRPVAHHCAPPSVYVMVVTARFERATTAFEERRSSTELRDSTPRRTRTSNRAPVRSSRRV